MPWLDADLSRNKLFCLITGASLGLKNMYNLFNLYHNKCTRSECAVISTELARSISLAFGPSAFIMI